MIAPFPVSVAYRRSTRGAVVVFVLLLLILMGMLSAGWISLINARSGMVDALQLGVQRRIALENSKALAQQYMLERAAFSNAGSSFTYDLPQSGWGGIRVPDWSSSPLKSFEKSAGVNHFNPGNGDGYTQSPIEITFNDGHDDPTRLYAIKSRAPAFSGTILSMHRPTLSSSASINVGNLSMEGHSMLWLTSLGMSFRTAHYSLGPSVGLQSFLNTSGNTIPQLNSARPRMFSNPRLYGASVYGGELDAIHNTHLSANSSVEKATTDGVVVNALQSYSVNGVSSDGNGTVLIRVGTKGLGNVYLPGHVRHLILEGQDLANDLAADDLPAMLIVLNQGYNSFRELNQITLSKHNHRRVVLAVKKSYASTTTYITPQANNANWRLLMELENTPIYFYNLSRMFLRGGIRSDRALTTNNAQVVLRKEHDPKNLERFATRQAWVESIVP